MEKGKKTGMADGGDSAFGGVCSVPREARLVAAQKAATKVVVLDSGHGGDAIPAKSGQTVSKEKDINLAIARLLKKKLEKQGNPCGDDAGRGG